MEVGDMIDVSICMPFYERLEELDRTLDSFKKCGYFDEGYPFKVELSICDDGSVENPVTYEWLKEKVGEVFILHNSPEKPYWANPCVPLNIAVKQSSGRYILLQGPETVHRVPIIKAMVDLIERENDTVLCPAKDTKVKTWQGWRLHPVHQPKKFWFCQMLHRDLWEDAGGMDERFRKGWGGFDDDALVIRLDQARAVWHWLPDEYHVIHHWTGPLNKSLRRTLPEIKRVSNRKVFEEHYGKAR
jgi:glycosyltransferase involved in cell wall biosynthesis